MAVNRKDTRVKLAEWLKQNLDSSIIDPEAVFDHPPSTFEHRTPVVYLTSSGSGREDLTGLGFQTTFVINVHVLVLASSQTGVDQTAVYDAGDVEDRLDDIEHGIATAIENQKANRPYWQKASYARQSNADVPLSVEGDIYQHEIIPLELEVF
jgi:hypothetical protein